MLMNCLSFLSSSLPLKVQLSNSLLASHVVYSAGSSSFVFEPSSRVSDKKLFSDSKIASHELRLLSWHTQCSGGTQACLFPQASTDATIVKTPNCTFSSRELLTFTWHFSSNRSSHGECMANPSQKTSPAVTVKDKSQSSKSHLPMLNKRT